MNTNLYSHRFGWLNALIITAVISFLLFLILIEAWGALRRDDDPDRRAICLNHLRQLALALRQYALDNNGVYPWGTLDFGDENKKIMKFKDDKIVSDKLSLQPYQSFGMLHPSYTSTIEIFRCPSSTDEKWDSKNAHFRNKDNRFFTQVACKNSLSYAYGVDKDGNGKDIQGAWTEEAQSTVRIAGDKYACTDYSIGNIRNKPSNHITGGRNVAIIDGSAKWDDSKKPLEANPHGRYPASSKSPESDQTGADWWSDPPEKP